MDGMLLGPGPLAIAITRPYEAYRAYEVGEFRTRESRIFKCIVDIPLPGEEWTPLHWAEVKITDEIDNLQDQIDSLNPESGVGLFTDATFEINSNQWVAGNSTWSFNFANALIKSTSGVVVYYDDSFRTALSGDIKIIKNTGYVTFVTNGEPQGQLTGTLRIVDSVTGVLPTYRGGTGAITAKGARRNLNVSIRPIPVTFGTVSSLPQTIYDGDITSDMIPSKWFYGTPSACPQGLKCTTADGSVTISLPSGGTFTGTTTVYLELVNPRTIEDGGTGQEEEQLAADYVQLSAQTLTPQQKAQVLDNIGGASDADVSDINDKLGTVTSGTTLQGQITTINTTLNSKVNTSAIANNLTTNAEGYVLDARQGKALNDKIRTITFGSVTGTTSANANLSLGHSNHYIISAWCNDVSGTVVTLVKEINNGAWWAHCVSDGASPSPKTNTRLTINFYYI